MEKASIVPIGTFHSSGAHFKVVAFLKEFRCRKANAAKEENNDDDDDDDEEGDDFDPEAILDDYLALTSSNLAYGIPTKEVKVKLDREGEGWIDLPADGGDSKSGRQEEEGGEEEEYNERESWSTPQRQRQQRPRVPKTSDRSKVKGSSGLKKEGDAGGQNSRAAGRPEGSVLSTTSKTTTTTSTASVALEGGGRSNSVRGGENDGEPLAETVVGISRRRNFQEREEEEEEEEVEEEEEDFISATPPGRKKKRFSFRDSRD